MSGFLYLISLAALYFDLAVVRNNFIAFQVF
jgi:hypothetical protein